MIPEACRQTLWNRYCRYRLSSEDLGFSLDVSRVRFEDDYLDRMTQEKSAALDAMAALEAGAVANRDENRMVGHYWLRAPQLAPSDQIRGEIEGAIDSVSAFASAVHDGTIQGADGPFSSLVHVGIGGSALGPELVCVALASASDRVRTFFLDNSDPDSIDRLSQLLGNQLGGTLVSVVSKSGWTPTPQQVTSELEALYERAGLRFADHAVATTMPGSELDLRARKEGWLGVFPMWDWVGGRTSVTSAVGLLPAALQGLDVAAFLRGAAEMDELTRRGTPAANPAMLLALMWHWLGNGRGDKHMVLLPYKDRLALFPRYIQQLVMESIGKRLSRDGSVVEQGLIVFGNKGSTDQHAYVQQLREGPANFFVTFVCAGLERSGPLVDVEPGVTLGDYLFGHAEGTRDALYERGRQSITITLRDVSEFSLGALIALYERAVGLYAELLNVNAYHQPGVDKNPAAQTVELQKNVLAYLGRCRDPHTAEEIASAIGERDRTETVHKLLERLAADSRRRIAMSYHPDPTEIRFSTSLPTGGDSFEIDGVRRS